VVYTVQDNYQSPQPATDTTTFTQYGVTDFNVQGWDGSQWVTLATVSGNNLVKRTVTFNAFTTSRIRINVTGALYYVSRIVEVEAYGQGASGASTPANVALASNGGVASASSQLNSDYPIAAINDGERAGVNWTHGGGWADGSISQWPDWVQIDFNGAKTLDEIDVFGLQDNRGAPVDPTAALTCAGCPIDFTVQYWTGVSWQAIPNGIVRNNTLVWRTFTFAPITATRVRVLVEHTNSGWSELTEVEAYGTDAGP